MANETPSSELERWNARFSVEHYIFGTAPNAFLAAQAPRLRPGMRALCVADGEGRNSVWLAQQGLHVRAFDFSPTGLVKARKLAADAGVRVDYRQADIREWNWDAEQYDVVAAIFIQFLTPAERPAVFDGLKRALKPGGLLILQGYRPEQIPYGTGGPKQPEQMYTEPLLRQHFGGLEVLHLASHDDEIDEGPRHRGMSALIDLVARRP